MSFLSSLKTSASGLTAQRLRLDTISNNLANANTTRTLKGGSYKKQMVVFTPITKQYSPFSLAAYTNAATLNINNSDDYTGGVKVASIVEDKRQGKLSYEPGHPDANSEGYVEYPNVNVVTEMVDMISANRSYEANVTAISAAKSMALKALDIGRA